MKKLTAAAPALDPELLLAMFEAKTDIWAIDVKLTRFIKSVAMVMRSLPGVPPSERERIIAKQEALVDALVRAAHVEGMLRGGKDVLESLGVKARREAGS